MRELTIIQKAILWLNQPLIILLVITYLAPYVNPSTFWPIAILGLAYPVLVLINLAFVIFWLLARRFYFLLSLVAILLGGNLLLQFVHYPIINKEGNLNTQTSFKVMTYNVQQFGLYNYNKDWSYNYTQRNHILSLISKEKPDIICFQESYSDRKNEFITFDSIVKSNNDYKIHLVNWNDTSKFGLWGGVTLTKFPIISMGEFHFHHADSYNICFYTDMKIKNDTIRIYNIHLQSLQFSNDEILNHTHKPYKTIPFWEKLTQLIVKLRKGFQKRAEQVDVLAENIKSSPYKVILCGDFNDTPCSYSYRKLSETLNDAFLDKGKGISSTYTLGFAIFRIDYILHNSSIVTNSYDVIEKKYSDHYPIVSNLSFPDSSTKKKPVKSKN